MNSWCAPLSCSSLASGCWSGIAILFDAHQRGRARQSCSISTAASENEVSPVAQTNVRLLRDVVSAHVGDVNAGRGSPPASRKTSGLDGWSQGTPGLFRLRCGPNYRANGLKAVPGSPMYKCIGVEVVRGQEQIFSALSSIYQVACVSEILSTHAASSTRDDPPLQLPTVILVNFQIPFQTGPVYGKHPPDDAGCSVLLFFTIEPHVVDELSDLASASAGTRMLVQYFQESGHPLREGTHVSRCLKVVGYLDNLDELNIPSMMKPLVERFNGKPVLIEKESQRYARGSFDIVEIAVDVRGFNPVARSLLRKLREQLKQTSVQLGLLLQGCADDELPEQFFGCVHLRGLDFVNGQAVEVATAAMHMAGGDIGPFERIYAPVARLFGRISIALRSCGSRRRPHDTCIPFCSEVSTPWATPRSRGVS